MVRVKRRYVVFKIHKRNTKESIDEHEMSNEIRSQVERTYGDFGIGILRRGFVMKKFDDRDGYAVLQIRKGAHEMVMSVLPLITQINDKQCTCTLLHLSGTMRCSLKQLRLDYIRKLRAAIGKKMALEAATKVPMEIS